MSIPGKRPPRKRLLLFILAISLMVPWTPVLAESFEEGGFITEISLKGFFIDDNKHRLSPGAKLLNPSAARGKLKDLRPGDLISGRGVVLNGVRYLEVITYFPMQPN